MDDAHVFAAKFDILHTSIGFAVRCRAFWDKAIGILFLLYDDTRYDSFVKAKSRRKFFRKRAVQWPPISDHIANALKKVDVDELASLPGAPDYATKPPFQGSPDSAPPFHEHLLQIVDTLDEVRTAEVHGAGILRKWSLAMLPLDESKDAWLINYWNIANRFIRALRHALLDLVGHPVPPAQP